MGFPVDMSESTKASDLEGSQSQLEFRLPSNCNGGPVVRRCVSSGVTLLSADAG